MAAIVAGSDRAVASSRITLGERLRRFEMLNYFVTLASFLTKRLGRDDRGATAVESGLMVALIVTALTLIGTNLPSVFNTVASAL
jgi:pilus assembly protein Flp/PilA